MTLGVILVSISHEMVLALLATSVTGRFLPKSSTSSPVAASGRLLTSTMIWSMVTLPMMGQRVLRMMTEALSGATERGYPSPYPAPMVAMRVGLSRSTVLPYEMPCPGGSWRMMVILDLRDMTGWSFFWYDSMGEIP